MRDRLVWCGILLVAALSVVTVCTLLRAQLPTAQDATAAGAVFELRETPVLESGSGGNASGMMVGARATCQEQPHPTVTAYPALGSKQPIYGLLRLAPDPTRPESGTPLYFVVDESGDTYDRLYVDLNGDLDLTNDPVVVPMKAPPAGAVPLVFGLACKRSCLRRLPCPWISAPTWASRPVRLVPRLEIQEYEGKAVSRRGVHFGSHAAKADIKIGNRPYHAVLAQRIRDHGPVRQPVHAVVA